ncbi:protein Shroom1 [Canis lupus familiaris]|uniref:Shroom family member 1 n=1 Tax=Canis lupus familiaris TaxID=9615 RepID=A0A8C0QH78_CANLF|nr:protein Shroom1 [Canis lupus familiaris]XP_025288784.3 protein Shroom1 [Canis lupus dingo]XP_038408071.1 protein Shroom1 [Canis lupus familiaris]|eukprot:XP_013973192.1 protein Shroom1 [Canis lupus familiaris]
MEAPGPGGDRASPASSTRSLDLRRLSARADSAYSSFSAASAAPEPEPRTPSPGTDLLPYLDWDYVRVVWGGPGPAGSLRASAQPRPAAAARSGPRPPEVQGTPGPLSRQATPLLFALAAEAEAEAAARLVEPPSPPASRAAYRQRLQGAQRRVLRETSFQRKELRMSLPGRLRPAAPARPPAAHPRSASLSHPAGGGGGGGGEVEPARPGATAARADVGRGRLATQQRQWCFSEPGKLDRVGRGGGAAGERSGEAACSSGIARPGTRERRVLAQFQGHQTRRLPESPPRGTEDPESGSAKLGDAYRPSGRSQSQSASGEVLAPWGGPGGVMPIVQAVPQGAETPRPLFQAQLARFLTQKEAAVVCSAVYPQSSPADCEQRASETCIGCTRLPSLPDDEVFLEEVPLAKMRSPLDTHTCPESPTSIYVSDQRYGTGSGQRADQATDSPENPLHEHPETARADDCHQRIHGSVGVSGTIYYRPPGTANGDIATFHTNGLLTIDSLAATESDPLKPLPVDVLGPPSNNTPGAPGCTAEALAAGQPGSRPTWPSPRLEELVQELARLDPSMSDTLTSCPSPEPPLDLLDGLIPLAEVWAAMRPACKEAGKEAAGSPEPGSSQLLPTSQEETRFENQTTRSVPDQACGEHLPDPNSSIQAKKMELADLLQTMLRNLQAEQEQLHQAAQAWARRGAALEAAVGQACAPRDLERFSRFMADIERVLGLLLLLGSRLGRVRRALARAGADSDPDEQASLLQRLGLLQRQQEDAKELKEHVARRERALREVLVQALPPEELSAYHSLLVGKAAVLAQQRSLDERVRLLQDQLDAVRSDLGPHPLPPRLAWLPEACLPDKPPFLPPLI